MAVRFSYRESIKPKNGKSKYYRRQGVHIYKYRDENGIEHMKITRYFKWGKYENVSNNQSYKSVLQDSEQTRD